MTATAPHPNADAMSVASPVTPAKRPPDEILVLARFPRATSQEVRLCVCRHGDRIRIDLRTWGRESGRGWVASKLGVSLSVVELDVLEAALRVARARSVEMRRAAADLSPPVRPAVETTRTVAEIVVAGVPVVGDGGVRGTGGETTPADNEQRGIPRPTADEASRSAGPGLGCGGSA
jgi:hypothetical protein